MPKVSIIIPTHNRLDLVKKAVFSVLNQTYKDFEVLVVDDGDVSAESLLKSIGDNRVKYIKHESPHRGGSASRNSGIKNASGEFLAFLDDDDEWLPEKLELQISELTLAGPDVGYCFSAAENVFEDRVESTSHTVPDGEGYYFERALTRFNGFLTVTLVVKKSALDEIGHFDENLPSHQEVDLMLRLAKKYKGIAISKTLVRVNMTKHESIGSSWERRVRGREMILKKHFNEFKKRPAVLAKHYFQLGLWHRDNGRTEDATAYFKRALTAKFNVRFAYHYFFSKLSSKKAIVKYLNKFHGLWQTPSTTGQQVARGGIILFLERFFGKGLQFIRTIVIARLLFPTDIGLFALATLSLASVSVFVQLGLNSAIIQEKKDVRKYLDNAWTAGVLRGVFLSVVMFFSATWFGDFFNNDAVVPLIRALGILALIEGLDNIGMVLLQKEMAINKQFFYNILGNLAQIIVIVIAALMFENVWALVIGTIAGRLAFMILSYVYHSYRPRFDFNFRGSWHLFKFGRWVALGGIVSFFATRGDSLVIGKLLLSEELAFYQMAFALGTLPAVEFAKTLSVILFPLYSKIQGDTVRMRESFIRIARLVLLVMIPASVGMFVLGPEIVTYVYGSRWLPMVPIFYVVLIIGLFKSFEYLITPMLSGMGKPYISTMVMTVQSVAMFSVILPLTTNYGSTGTAMAVLVGVLVAQIIYTVKLYKEIKLSLLPLLRESLLPILASLVMWALLYWLKAAVYINSHLLLVAFVILGALSYSFSVVIMDSLFGQKIKGSFLWLKQNI